MNHAFYFGMLGLYIFLHCNIEFSKKKSHFFVMIPRKLSWHFLKYFWHAQVRISIFPFQLILVRKVPWYLVTNSKPLITKNEIYIHIFICLKSSNGNIFRVTGHLWGESPVTGGFPSQRPVTPSFDVPFYLRLNKWLSKQAKRLLFETPSRSLLRHCN